MHSLGRNATLSSDDVNDPMEKNRTIFRCRQLPHVRPQQKLPHIPAKNRGRTRGSAESADTKQDTQQSGKQEEGKARPELGDKASHGLNG